MRITTGKYKGRNIFMPKGIRPTQDKVRKAIFDILGDIEGLSFLELFAGSGAVGIEAASRGAQEVVFVENNPNVLKMLTSNTSYILHTKYCILSQNVESELRRLNQEKKQFDIIFLDPPYYQDLAKKTLQTLGRYDILSPNGLIVAEHFKKENLPDDLGVLSLFRQYKYGSTILSLFKREGKHVPSGNISRDI